MPESTRPTYKPIVSENYMSNSNIPEYKLNRYFIKPNLCFSNFKGLRKQEDYFIIDAYNIQNQT